jgi:hypothetical protein
MTLNHIPYTFVVQAVGQRGTKVGRPKTRRKDQTQPGEWPKQWLYDDDDDDGDDDEHDGDI